MSNDVKLNIFNVLIVHLYTFFGEMSVQILYPFFKFYLLIFRQRKTSMCGWLSHIPYYGPGPQPRHVPWLGIELMTLWFAGWRSIHWATSQGLCPFLNWDSFHCWVVKDYFFVYFAYNTLIRYMICKYFLPICGLLFTSLTVFFEAGKFWIWIMFYLSFFLLLLVLWVSCLALALGLWFILSWFLYIVRNKGAHSFFCMWISVIPEPSVEKTILYLVVLEILLKITWL